MPRVNNGSDFVGLWLQLAYGDIYNHLVISTSYYTGQQMKAYKSLEAYNYFISGWVQQVCHKTLENDKELLIAKVRY